MAIKFSNNASTVISSDITATDTSIPVTDASVFPALGAGEHTYVTLENTNGDLEIVKVTAISSNTLTVVRGQDGTTARAYSTGDFIQLRVTAALLNDLSQEAATTEWADILNKPDSVITLSGDVSGSGTMTDLGSVTITTSVSGYNNTNWDTAYSWGDHGAAGYLTSFTEADPVFSASAAASISATNITNWNTAYGWGDHASAGYLTGNQTITLSGDASGSGTTSIVVTVADDSHNHIISNVDGLQTALDGKLGATAAAVSADKWTTARTVSLTGAVTGSASVDGSANVSIATTHTADPTITLTGAVTGSGTMTNLGNVSIATTATADPTLTLAGDASGSATFTNLGNATLTVTVADDSHNHIISNVDGLQTALDGKFDEGYLSNRSISDANSADSAGVTAFYLSSGATNKPTGTDHALWTYSYSNIWAVQEAGDWRTNARYIRNQNSGTWGSWQRLFADDYHPNADKWTTARTLSLTGAVTGSASIDGSGNVSLATTATSDPTLTLSGDATGSATFTNLGNATLSVTVVDDSHNHVISNVDGLQTALNGKQAASTALGYVDVAVGNYGTIKVDDDRGVTWAGYAIRDDWVFMSNGADYAGIYNDTDNEWSIYCTRNGSTDLYFNGVEEASTQSGYFLANNQMRAPIFYDSNNTGYYTNPASTSVLNALRLDSTAASQLYTNNQYLNIRYGSTGAGGIRLYDQGDVLQGFWYGSGGGEHGFLDNDGDWAVRIRTGTNPNIFYCNGNAELYVYTSYVRAIGSFRAPLFYDFNNTAYFFHGDSTGDSIRVAGDIVAYYSDERLKTNLGNIESPVDKVKQLNGFKYHANELGAKHGYDPEKIQVGVSAQEVEAVLPEVVRDAPIGHGYKTVQYERLVPLLIEAIKEQAGQIEVLQAEVAKLKG